MLKGFWSYARNDDRYGKITKLKNAFDQMLLEVSGEYVNIYMDTTHIHWGEVWKKAIESGISGGEFFIAILTPSYFKRTHCLFELDFAIEHGIKILPIYYRKVPIPEKKRQDFSLRAIELAKKVFDINYRDFRELRYKHLQEEKVQEFLDGIAEELADN